MLKVKVVEMRFRGVHIWPKKTLKGSVVSKQPVGIFVAFFPLLDLSRLGWNSKRFALA